MIALWIVLAVVLVVLVTGTLAYLPRRRRSASGPEPRGAGTTVLEPRRQPDVAAPPEPSATPPEPSATPTARREEPPPEAAVSGRAEPAVVEERPAAPPQLRERLGKTRGLFSGYVRSLRSRGSVDDETWDELEEALLRADVGVATTTTLIEDLRARVRKGELRGPDAVVGALRDDMRVALESPNGAHVAGDGHGPRREQTAPADSTALGEEEDGEGQGAQTVEVWLFVGVNGVGKTTTIGKVARNQAASGRSVLLAAGDTFRAAAVEQLAAWAERTGVDMVKGNEGADPSAVVYDAVRSAAARGRDLVLADTAGRLHTKVNLIEELKKIRRVASRPPGRVTEVLLVLDATTGQNALAQARQFLDAVGVTGVVLTKLDGTAKGGIVVAIRRELGLPVKLVGVGEGADDLIAFEPSEFVDALFD